MRTTAVRRSFRAAVATAAATVVSVGLLGLSGPASAATNFRTLNDHADPTFNQLLGINDHGKIAGYFGSGATGHPNQGYTIVSPYAQSNYANENYPGAVQTQVTGINNGGTTVGFYVGTGGNSFGFIDQNNTFTQVKGVTQLLGLNNKGVAVGFSTDATGHTHAVTYNLASHKITRVAVSGNPANTTATGINDSGNIAGFYSVGAGTDGFLIMGGVMKTFTYGDMKNTQAFGLNNSDIVVGFYSNGVATHGFLTNGNTGKAMRIDDPNALPGGATVVNGLNNTGQIVGFYTDSAGNVDGFIAHS